MNVIRAIEASGRYHMAIQYVAASRIRRGGHGYTVMIEQKNDGTCELDCWMNGESLGTTTFREGNEFQRVMAAQQQAMENSLAINPDRWMPAAGGLS